MKKITLYFLTGCIGIASAFSQTVTTFFDGTPDDAIALDSNGNIYASNFTGGTIFRFSPSGTMTQFINQIQNPNGLDFDSGDNLYVSEWGGNRILRFDSAGVLDTSITIPNNPSGMLKAKDNDDMLYTRYNGNTINRITPSGTITQISDDPLLNGPVGLAYDDAGALYIGNYNDRKIYKVLATGALQYVATVGNSSNLGFITFGQGMLWGTVLGEHKIYTIDPNGTDVVTLFAGSIAGGQDGPISQATFNQPNGIRFNDAEDTLYVTDFGSKNLRVITGILLAVNDPSERSSVFEVFPNPAEDTISIKMNGISLDKYRVHIYDVLGKIVFSSEDISNTTSGFQNINISSLNSGTYFIELSTEGFSEKKRMIKK